MKDPLANSDRACHSPVNGCWLAIVLALFATEAAAQDAVVIAGGSGGQTRMTGRILDYTGRQLLLERPGGQQVSFPAGQVLRVETELTSKHTEADGLFARRQHQQALALYREVVDAEPRRWVRRQIIARIVGCYDALGQADQAGSTFVRSLLADDPDTIHLDCIPLAWTPGQLSISAEHAARQWLKREEPAAVLLGASYLLGGSDRLGALRLLEQLAAGSTGPVGQLAMAQTWRAKTVTAVAAQVDSWGRAVEQIPESLAAGPYFAVGGARMRLGQWEQAALAMLRVAVLYPEQRRLAARSLLEAGRCLEKLGRSKEALRLYRELIRTHSEQTRPVEEARQRIEGMLNAEG